MDDEPLTLRERVAGDPGVSLLAAGWTDSTSAPWHANLWPMAMDEARRHAAVAGCRVACLTDGKFLMFYRQP